jgi:short-subunit dehydrogenase involved in D-alanine esterification of teichoic acids
MNLTGNKILITGATSGIGRALAERFLALDNHVLAVGRNDERLRAMAHQHDRVIPFACDISQTTELDRLILFIEQHHSDLNILVNNAGVQYNYDFPDEPHLLARIDYEISTNLLAPIRLIALLLPLLKVNPNAAIVNVSSGLGLVPKQQAPVYCGTKAGLHIFTKALRYQLQNVKVFEIIPPLVDTEMTQGRGRNKLSPDTLAGEFMDAFARDRFEINIGKVKLLRFIQRISPALADRIMRNGR